MVQARRYRRGGIHSTPVATKQHEQIGDAIDEQHVPIAQDVHRSGGLFEARECERGIDTLGDISRSLCCMEEGVDVVAGRQFLVITAWSASECSLLGLLVVEGDHARRGAGDDI